MHPNGFYYKSFGNLICDQENDNFLNIGTIQNEVTRPDFLYGSPKVHKALVSNCPKTCPITSAIGTSTYKITTFSVPILLPFIWRWDLRILFWPFYEPPGRPMHICQYPIGWNFYIHINDLFFLKGEQSKILKVQSCKLKNHWLKILNSSYL